MHHNPLLTRVYPISTAQTGGNLTASVVFSTLFLLDGLVWPLIDLPDLWGSIASARTSARRLSDFLRRDEVAAAASSKGAFTRAHGPHAGGVTDSMQQAATAGTPVWLNQCTLEHLPVAKLCDDSSDDEDNSAAKAPAATSDDRSTEGVVVSVTSEEGVSTAAPPPAPGAAAKPDVPVRAVEEADFAIPEGALWAIVGPVGSGKSSLLGGILGEVSTASGDCGMQGDVAYVPQQVRLSLAPRPPLHCLSCSPLTPRPPPFPHTHVYSPGCVAVPCVTTFSAARLLTAIAMRARCVPALWSRT